MFPKDELVNLGKVSSVYGIKGWVKVYSYTEPMDQILDYQDWILIQNGQQRQVVVAAGRSHGKGMIAHIEGCENREDAALLQGAEIHVLKEQLPDLDEGDFYWYQLTGLRVVTLDGHDLGTIQSMMSAGKANDVVVVKGDSQAVDREERLIPYLPDHTVIKVDLEANQMTVDWQPDY